MIHHLLGRLEAEGTSAWGVGDPAVRSQRTNRRNEAARGAGGQNVHRAMGEGEVAQRLQFDLPRRPNGVLCVASKNKVRSGARGEHPCNLVEEFACIFDQVETFHSEQQVNCPVWDASPIVRREHGNFVSLRLQAKQGALAQGRDGLNSV